MVQMTDHATVSRWVSGYEAAWRTPGTAGLAQLFTQDASYQLAPYEEPIAGLDAIRQMWDQERDGPDEVFTIAAEIVAVEGTAAVVRAEVRYGDPARREFRDLWVLRLTDDELCSHFEEWPYSPEPSFTATEETS
jgi:ketosteroid isomerase-like protein